MIVGIEQLRKDFPEKIELTQKEKDLILMIRHQVKFGSVEIEIKNGEPIFLNRISIRRLLGE